MDSGLESEGEIKSENNQKKYFKQLWGAPSTQKMVKIHNKYASNKKTIRVILQ